MLGFSPISSVVISDSPGASLPVTLNLAGQQLTVQHGNFSVTYADTLSLVGKQLVTQRGNITWSINPVIHPVGWQLTVRQGVLIARNDIVVHLTGQTSLVVQQGVMREVQGQLLPGVLMQARQGQIGIRKELYFLYADDGQFVLKASDTGMYHSVFTPDPMEGTIIVYNTPQVVIEIMEDA